jgi:hypothetical protein
LKQAANHERRAPQLGFPREVRSFTDNRNAALHQLVGLLVTCTYSFSVGDPPAAAVSRTSIGSQTLTPAQVTGGQFVAHANGGGNAITMTLPGAAAWLAARPNWQASSSYTLRFLNGNSGTLTITAGDAGTTINGAPTIAAGAFRYLEALNAGAGYRAPSGGRAATCN